jgi:hypothetical protein
MKTKKIFFLIAAISIVAACTLAQEKAGTTSMQFLKVMPCARATALGDAYSSVAIGAEALYWNPAGLAWADKKEISLTYINWIFDSKLYDFAFGMPLGNIGSIGFQLRYVDYGTFEEAIANNLTAYPGQDLPYLTGKTWKPYDFLFGLSYARKVTDKFSFGLSVKYAYESLYDQNEVSSYAMGSTGGVDNTYTLDTRRDVFLFDAGFRYYTGFRTVYIAASVQNFGPDVAYKTSAKTTRYPAPLSFRLGASADLIGPNSLLSEQSNSRLGIMFDIFLANDADQQEHIGLEYEFANTFAVRLGYKVNYETEGLTYGAGIHQNLSGIKLSIDYSYSAMNAMISDYVGNVHRISLGVEIQ